MSEDRESRVNAVLASALKDEEWTAWVVTDDLVTLKVAENSAFGIPLAMLEQLSKAFGTDNINVRGDYEQDWSDVTPGAGTEVYIEIRGYRLPEVE